MVSLETQDAPKDSKMDTVVSKDIKANSLISWGINKQCIAHIEYQSGLPRVPNSCQCHGLNVAVLKICLMWTSVLCLQLTNINKMYLCQGWGAMALL